MVMLYKTDTSVKQTADTISLSQAHKNVSKAKQNKPTFV